MIELKGALDYIGLFALASVLGGVGGLAFELMQTRRGQTGWVESPHRVDRGRYHDWGVVANLIIGAIAAVAALWLFPPIAKTTVAAGHTTTTTEYDIIKVVGLSLIIGSAGSSVLAALQARALALVKDQEAQQTRRVAEKQLEHVKSIAESGASNEQIAAQVDGAKKAVAAVGGDGGLGNPEFA
jgi:hypothetical protein